MQQPDRLVAAVAQVTSNGAGSARAWIPCRKTCMGNAGGRSTGPAAASLGRPAVRTDITCKADGPGPAGFNHASWIASHIAAAIGTAHTIPMGSDCTDIRSGACSSYAQEALKPLQSNWNVHATVEPAKA